jgi:hypothetical protein
MEDTLRGKELSTTCLIKCYEKTCIFSQHAAFPYYLLEKYNMPHAHYLCLSSIEKIKIYVLCEEKEIF